MDWQDEIRNLFSQIMSQTMEDAVEQILFVSEDDSARHEKILLVFKIAIENAKNKNKDVISAINVDQELQVRSYKEAISVLEEFRELYITAYNRDNA